MNAVQRLIQSYIDEHPGESYASIARRAGMPRQTVYALAKRSQARQTPRPDTIKKLAKGLGTSEAVVRAAAGATAGYAAESNHGTQEIVSEQRRLLIAVLDELDAERLAAVERRARALHQEQIEERDARRRRR